MLSVRKNPEPAAGMYFAFLLASLLVFAITSGAAAAENGRLTIVPADGVVLLDYDTLDVSGNTEFEVTPGEHLLSFFPSHTAGRWVHRYLDYHFNMGDGGNRTINLTDTGVFSFRSNPQGASIEYRGREIGRTPGDYLLLLGTGDSVVIGRRGYHSRVIRIDEEAAKGSIEVFASLDQASPQDADYEIEPVSYVSPFKQILEPKMLLSLGAGAALLAAGVHYNKLADDHYQRYLHFAGSQAREKAYQDALHNDRLSRTAFIAGDVSIGLFGYFVIRKLIFHDPGTPGRERKKRALSLDVDSRGTVLSLKW